MKLYEKFRQSLQCFIGLRNWLSKIVETKRAFEWQKQVVGCFWRSWKISFWKKLQSKYYQKTCNNKKHSICQLNNIVGRPIFNDSEFYVISSPIKHKKKQKKSLIAPQLSSARVHWMLSVNVFVVHHFCTFVLISANSFCLQTILIIDKFFHWSFFFWHTEKLSSVNLPLRE